MALNYGRLLSSEFDCVEADIRTVVEIAHRYNLIVKIITENCCLTDYLMEIACGICERPGADFDKTSAGFGTGGATPEDLKLMRKTCSSKVLLTNS